MLSILRGRRLKEPAAEATQYTTSAPYDQPLLKPVVKINKAHMAMLITQNLVGRKDGVRCLEALATIPEDFTINPELEDVHMNVEAYVINQVGEEAGGQLNLAKSRNDQVATAIRMVLREHLLNTITSLLELCEVLLKRCREHVETVMPGYTHLQHAQPTTLAHHLLAYCDAFLRGCERLAEVFTRVNRSPMGAAALSTTSLNIDRGLVAELLGFEGIVENSIDAVSSRDFAVEAVAHLSLVMTDLSRLAEEVVLWSSCEFGMVEVSDEYASTSSIMPQKKNAVVAEVVRARASMVYGDLIATLTILKSLPYSYNLDLQELTPRLWDACTHTLESIKVMKGMVESLKFNRERMRELVCDDMSLATDLTDHLVKKHHIPFRAAHRIVGGAARRAWEQHVGLKDVVEDLVKAVKEEFGAEVSADELTEVLDVEKAVEARGVAGGPKPSEVERMINERAEEVERMKSWVNMKVKMLSEADFKLEEKIKSLKGGV